MAALKLLRTLIFTLELLTTYFMRYDFLRPEGDPGDGAPDGDEGGEETSDLTARFTGSAADRGDFSPYPFALREIEGAQTNYEAALAIALSDGEELMDAATFLNSKTLPGRLTTGPNPNDEIAGWLLTPTDGDVRVYNVGIIAPDGKRSVEQWANAENGAVVPNYFARV